MINTELLVAFVAVMTMCTAIYIGLGFLPRPSRAAGIWSAAFIGGMLSAYARAAADALDSWELRGVSSGVMVAVVALFWVGLRVRRGASAPGWGWTIAFAIAAPVTLALLATTDMYLTGVRVVFGIAGIFAVLTVIELIRLGARLRDEVLPMALVSAAFGILSALNLIQEGVRLIRGGGDMVTVLGAARDLNVLGSLLYAMCATVTLLLLTRSASPHRGTAAATTTFSEIAGDRLRRAQAADDRWWSILVLRLDDPAALRDASGTNGFDKIAADFGQLVRATVPADADLWARDPAEFVVLLPRPEGAVRQELARLLREIAEADPESPIPVRLSASVGWAAVDAVGYDLDALIAAADAAAARAQERGGDRWERVTAGDVAPPLGSVIR